MERAREEILKLEQQIKQEATAMTVRERELIAKTELLQERGLKEARELGKREHELEKRASLLQREREDLQVLIFILLFLRFIYLRGLRRTDCAKLNAKRRHSLS